MSYMQTLVVYLILFLSLAYALNKSDIPFTAWLIQGLRWYELMPTLSSLTAKGQEATRGKSKSAKHRPSSGTTLPSISESDIASKIDYDLNCPIARSISVKDVLSLPEFETFNIAVSQVLVILVQWAASELLSRCFQRLSSPLLTNVSILMCLLVLQRLFSLQRRSLSVQGRPNTEELYTVAAAAVFLAFVFALWILLAPSWLLDVRVQAGIRGIQDSGSQWSNLFAQMSREHPLDGLLLDPPSVAPVAAFAAGDGEQAAAFEVLQSVKAEALTRPNSGLTIALSLALAALGGLHSALILMPSIRVARCLRLVLHPPAWDMAIEQGTVPLSMGAGSRALAYLTVMSPAACLLLWFKPIAQDLLGLNSGQAGMAQGLGMAFCGLVQLMAFRPLLQTYLNSSLIRWHKLKHGHTLKMGHSKDVAKMTHNIMNNTGYMTCRVALHIAGPAILNVLLGVLLCDSIAYGRVPPELEDDDHVLQGAVWRYLTPAPPLVAAVCGFLAFTSVLMQTVYAMSTLALMRCGVLNV